jgi:hypothetical protein
MQEGLTLFLLQLLAWQQGFQQYAEQSTWLAPGRADIDTTAMLDALMHAPITQKAFTQQ